MKKQFIGEYSNAGNLMNRYQVRMSDGFDQPAYFGRINTGIGTPDYNTPVLPPQPSDMFDQPAYFRINTGIGTPDYTPVTPPQPSDLYDQPAYKPRTGEYIGDLRTGNTGWERPIELPDDFVPQRPVDFDIKTLEAEIKDTTKKNLETTFVDDSTATENEQQQAAAQQAAAQQAAAQQQKKLSKNLKPYIIAGIGIVVILLGVRVLTKK